MNYIYMYILAVLDTRFYFYDGNDFHIEIYVSSLHQDDLYDDTSVIIHFPWADPDRPEGIDAGEDSFTLGKRSARDWRGTYSLSLSQWDTLTNKGIRVESSEEISVQFASGLPGASVLSSYSALPLTAHSTDFYLASYQRRIEVYSPLFIIGTGRKASTVTVYDQGGRLVWTCSMAAYSVQEILANSSVTDTTGYRITSSQPVAVFSGHQCANVPVDAGFCESFLQQMPPVRTLQTDYVVGPVLGIEPATGYTARVVITAPDTQLTVQFDSEHNTVTADDVRGGHLSSPCNVSRLESAGGTTMTPINCDRTLDPGSFVEVQSTNASSPVVVRCSASCLTTLYNYGTEMVFGQSLGDEVLTDVFMLVVPPVGLRSQRVRFSTVMFPNTSFVSYTNVITVGDQEQGRARLTFDSRDVSAGTWNTSVTHKLGRISVHALEVPAGVHSVRLETGNVEGLSALVYGHALGGYLNAYAFPAAFMDRGTMGPLPPGEPDLPQSAMAAVLASTITILLMVFIAAFLAALYVSYKRKRHRTPLLPAYDN